MSGEKPQDDFNRDRAELFDALGHPTRIKILQVLSESPLGFSDLKKEAGIESNGLLSFHLGKLDGLVKTSLEGSYQLTDEGREALRIVAVKEPAELKTKYTVTPLQIIVVALVIALAFTISFSYYSNQQQNSFIDNLNQKYSDLNQSYYNLNTNYNNLNQSYYNLAQLTSGLIGINSSISPPISEAQAVQIVFNEAGLSEATLIDKRITIQLDYVTIDCVPLLLTGGCVPLIGIVHVVTEPVSNYSAVIVNGTTYYYAWAVTIQPNSVQSSGNFTPLTFPYYIDAATGQVLQYGMPV